MTDELKYPVNPLNAINEGCVLDLRVRMAAEFIKGGCIGTGTPAEIVALALDTATELMAQAESRGMVQSLAEDSSDMPKVVKRHIELHARAQIHAQESTQRFMRDNAPIVTGGMAVPPGVRLS